MKSTQFFTTLFQVDRSEPLMMNREVENAFLRNTNAHFITGTNHPSTSTPSIELNLGENQIFRPRRILVDSRSSYTKIDLKSREGDCILNNDYKEEKVIASLLRIVARFFLNLYFHETMGKTKVALT